MDKSAKINFSLPFWQYGLTLLVLGAGIILSALAWMNICTEACAAGHKYRLFGFAFEPIGITFFCLTTAIFAFSHKYPALRFPVGILIFGAVGAEMMFTYAQKYIIGHWCPICLSIALTVLIAFLLFISGYFQQLRAAISQNDKEEVMKMIFKGLGAVLLITGSFLLTEAGFAKFNKLHAMETQLKDKISFGNKNSKYEVYIFTDWKCPSCRNIEPVIEASAPKIMEKAKLIFVDLPIHDESLNFTPYNLAFMVNNKTEYFKLRSSLEKISLKTDSPTEEQVEKAAKKLGVDFHPLNYSEVANGIKYFDHLVTQFEVNKTPTVVVVNSTTKKGKKLAGAGEINEKSILSALETVK